MNNKRCSDRNYIESRREGGAGGGLRCVRTRALRSRQACAKYKKTTRAGNRPAQRAFPLAEDAYSRSRARRSARDLRLALRSQSCYHTRNMQSPCDMGLLLLHDKSRWLLRRSAKQENRRRGGRASQATTHAPHSIHCAHHTTGPLPL